MNYSEHKLAATRETTGKSAWGKSQLELKNTTAKEQGKLNLTIGIKSLQRSAALLLAQHPATPRSRILVGIQLVETKRPLLNKHLPQRKLLFNSRVKSLHINLRAGCSYSK